MKLKFVRIGNPEYQEDLSQFDNEEYPGIAKYVGCEDEKEFLVNVDNPNDFYPTDEIFMMLDTKEFKTVILE